MKLLPLHILIRNYFQSPFTAWWLVSVSLLCDSILLEVTILCAWCLLLFAGAWQQGEQGACKVRRWVSSEWSRSLMQISAYLPPGFCEASKFLWVWFSSPDSAGLCFLPWLLAYISFFRRLALSATCTLNYCLPSYHHSSLFWHFAKLRIVF